MKKQIRVNTSSSLSAIDARKKVVEIYNQLLQGKSFYNNDLKVFIHCTGVGRKKTAFGGVMYPEKLAVISALPLILEQMTYNNWGNRKTTDPIDVVGYCNFKADCIVDGVKKHLNIAVRFKNEGKFYYSFDLNFWK